jgi:hypothetical protein
MTIAISSIEAGCIILLSGSLIPASRQSYYSLEWAMAQQDNVCPENGHGCH